MRKVFQDKAKIAHPVSYEKHKKSWAVGDLAKYYGDPQTLASYSFFMTRMDFLRVAEAMMKDYQNQTCVGRYLKDAQQNAEPWYRGRHLSGNAKLAINNYAQKYGYQFYFNFQGMSDRKMSLLTIL